MITLNNITKLFGSTRAVNQVSLEVNEGEIFGLVGSDGAGKTTVIRMLTGILAPTSGSLSVLGAVNPETVKNEIGYVSQKFSLYRELTVMENIRFMGALYGQSPTQIEVLAEEILGFTKLLAFKDRLTENLSGGMKQKLALAAGLMHRPRIYFLDEPTAGVDPVSRREFWQMLYRINKAGTTVFVSTPYMDEAELCTRVAFMNNGTIASCDSPRELRKSYPYKIVELGTPERNIKKYLTSVPIIDINAFGSKHHLVVDNAAAAIDQVRIALNSAGIEITSLTEISPNLEDVFVALASEVG